jgi:glutathione S-transferase
LDPSLAIVRTDPLRLYTFSLSHFSEKIRWTLSASGLAFEELPWTPFFHVPLALRRGGKTTVPILETTGARVQDSTRILAWLERNRAPFPLVPSSPEERDAAMAIEDRFDKVGSHVVRYAYSTVLDDAESVVRYWTVDATPRQTRVVRRWFPVMRWVFRRKLGMSAANVTRSREAIASGVEWLESQGVPDRPYLVGGRLTVADLTAAALLAPLACPDEHPIYGSARYRAGVEPLARAWQDGRAFAWVRQMYRLHRGAWARGPAIRAALESVPAVD